LTLAETLDIVKDLEIINIEIKDRGIEKQIIYTIKEFNLLDKTIISSFDHYSIVKIKQIEKYIKVGLLYMSRLYKPYLYAKKIGADALHPYYRTVTENMVKNSHKSLLEVNVFGVDDAVNYELEVSKLKKMDVDMIISNYPDKYYY